MRDVLRLVKQILREQEDGSDYDDLYFGMQDVRDLRGCNYASSCTRWCPL